MRIRPTVTALALLLVLAACSSPDSALGERIELGTSGAAACSRRPNMTHAMLQECVTLDGVRAHQAAFQAIADANGGTRVSGSPGYDASVDYVVETLEAAGYAVTVQPFDFRSFVVLGPSTLAQVSPLTTGYSEGSDYALMSDTEPGDVTAPVEAVDLALGLGNASTSGCEASDFAGFPVGSIALIQRGTCSFELKAENAAAAGAVGVIIFNQGNAPDRTGVIIGTLGVGYDGGIPAVFATYDLGVEWAATPGLSMRMVADVFRGTATSYNVLAETPLGDPSNVVMVGAHLDSVDEGPGIQDNGSGSAAILETAIQMANARVRNQVRFAWWGAEEAGLVGSDHYVFGLSDEERGAIALYLNFDMIASPNYGLFVYDGDGSSFGLAGPDGSAAIEARFATFYEDRGLAFEPTQISFRSDYAGFFDVGIPFGGIFTGAEGIKTPEQVALYGGTAGDQFDPCYHLACDTYDNVSLEALDLNADAVAYATLQYAMSTREINGRRGQGNFEAPRRTGPAPSGALSE